MVNLDKVQIKLDWMPVGETSDLLQEVLDELRMFREAYDASQEPLENGDDKALWELWANV